MKTAFFCFFISAATACAAQIGQTYHQILEKYGQPWGRIEAGSIRILRYPRQTIKLKDNQVIEVSAIAPSAVRDRAQTTAQGIGSSALAAHLEIAAIRLKRARTEDRIRTLVNQPPPGVPRTVRMRVQTISGAWYPETATAPDYATADVRTSQQKNYDGRGYLATGSNPGLAYFGDELEFNPVLNYFYVDRSVPKRKLTSAEMDQINGLFREIADCDKRLKSSRPPVDANSAGNKAVVAPASAAVATRPARREPHAEG